MRIKGGLGNQLFCYAAARRLAIVNKAELVIDDVSGFARDHQYKRKYSLNAFNLPIRKATPAERMEPFERYRRVLRKYISLRRPFSERKYLIQERDEFDSRLLDYKVSGTVYLDGYWQSERYFKDVEDVIRQDLRIIPPSDRMNQEAARAIAGNNSISVHVRWFHAPRTSSNHNLAGSYYTRAVRHILERIAAPHFFLFSDNPDAARSLLALPDEMVTCIRHNASEEKAYADLWLMSQCRHFIIAHSTFSWWGAWLSNAEAKIVISPKIALSGISAWGFPGLIPDEWVQIPVDDGE